MLDEIHTFDSLSKRILSRCRCSVSRCVEMLKNSSQPVTGEAGEYGGKINNVMDNSEVIPGL